MHQNKLFRWEDTPEVFGVKELSEILGIGKSKAYELSRRDSFPSFKVGNSIRISKKGLEIWIDSQIG
ncbi:MAG: helix-turn-helix domain-containing protein, partial [Oscillospiraceae bacterium]